MEQLSASVAERLELSQIASRLSTLHRDNNAIFTIIAERFNMSYQEVKSKMETLDRTYRQYKAKKKSLFWFEFYVKESSHHRKIVTPMIEKIEEKDVSMLSQIASELSTLHRDNNAIFTIIAERFNMSYQEVKSKMETLDRTYRQYKAKKQSLFWFEFYVKESSHHRKIVTPMIEKIEEKDVSMVVIDSSDDSTETLPIDWEPTEEVLDQKQVSNFAKVEKEEPPNETNDDLTNFDKNFLNTIRHLYLSKNKQTRKLFGQKILKFAFEQE
ncbi:hypothetical protein PVAND_013078 [Polypedilum vanderplanki]|uniref:Uncharacterized protein n=1 Tax=Polypedilum vanderplanki TaxID=319348 RepID=A0A9J6CQD0_POLVA|nr:hypothetical protein PVAND_013078 [Polypedilum vanderplanki]